MSTSAPLSSKIVYDSYRFSAANSARANVVGQNNGQLTSDGRFGFDCSGFVNYVLNKGGYSIGSQLSTTSTFTRNNDLTAAASKWQTKIDAGQVQPGDLVYFKNSAGQVDHVGIVVSYDPDTGKGVYRSSTTSKGVIDSSFTTTPGSDYWGGPQKPVAAFTRVTTAYDKGSDSWSDTDYAKAPPIEPAPALNNQSGGDSFLRTMGMWESPDQGNYYGDYTRVNGSGALGRYQMMPKTSLADLGYTDKAGNWLGKEVNGVAVTSKDVFLSNPNVQDAIAKEYSNRLQTLLQSNGAWDYVGKVVGGKLITAEGLIAASWEQGPQNALKVLTQVDAGNADFSSSPGFQRFGQRLDQFRGAVAPGQSGTIAVDPNALLPTGGGPNPAIPVPPLESGLRFDPNGGQTYSWVASADQPNGLYQAGDSVAMAYDKNGLPTGMTIWHIDNRVEATSFDRNAGTATYLQTKDGVVVQQYTYSLSDPQHSPLPNSTVIFNDKTYVLDHVTDNGQWVLRVKDDPGAAPANVDSGTLQPPQSPQQVIPEATSNNLCRADLGGAEVSFNTDVDFTGTSGDMLGFMPTGSRDLIASRLLQQGFTVDLTSDGISARRGNDYLIETDGAVQIRVGDKSLSLNVYGDTVVAQGTDFGNGDRHIFTSVDGQRVVIDGAYGDGGDGGGDGDDIEDSSANFVVRSISSINGASPSFTLTPQDLQAWGLTLDNLDAGTLPETAVSLIHGLDSAERAANGWADLQLTTTDLGNGLTSRSLNLGNDITLTNVTDVGGVVSVTEIATRTDGTQVVHSFDGQNRLLSTTLTDAGGEVLQKTAYTYTDDGTQSVVTDGSGQLLSRTVPTATGAIRTDYRDPSDPNLQTVTNFDLAGNVTSTTTLIQYVDRTVGSPTYGAGIPNKYTVVNTDADGTVTSTGQRVVNPIDGSYTDTLTIAANSNSTGGTVIVTQTAVSAIGINRPLRDRHKPAT